MTPGARLEKLVRDTATVLLPEGTRNWIRAQQRRYKLQSVPVGSVDFGGLRRLSPISAIFGKDRDLLTIERYYIEEFLAANATDIRGRVLEVGDASYTRRFGGDGVTQVDVLHAASGNPQATIVADLARGDSLPTAAFDCAICQDVGRGAFGGRKRVPVAGRIVECDQPANGPAVFTGVDIGVDARLAAELGARFGAQRIEALAGKRRVNIGVLTGVEAALGALQLQEIAFDVAGGGEIARLVPQRLCRLLRVR